MTTVTTFTWTPDPALMGARVFAVAEALENRSVPLAAASQAMSADIRERFETETDPSGAPWKEWADSYKDYAENYPNIGILKQEGNLMEKASSTEAMVVTNDTLFYETPMLPSYGLAHEEGLPDRKTKLPKRSFLGLSDEAAAVIFGYFSDWFDGTINLFVTRRGRIGRRHALRATPVGGRGGGFFIPR